jgi:hypothetical protein
MRDPVLRTLAIIGGIVAIILGGFLVLGQVQHQADRHAQIKQQEQLRQQSQEPDVTSDSTTQPYSYDRTETTPTEPLPSHDLRPNCDHGRGYLVGNDCQPAD